MLNVAQYQTGPEGSTARFSFVRAAEESRYMTGSADAAFVMKSV